MASLSRVGAGKQWRVAAGADKVRRFAVKGGCDGKSEVF